jgi:YHS domain-containing protein
MFRAMLASGLFVVVSMSSPLAQQPRPLEDAVEGIDTVVLLRDGKEVFGKDAFKITYGDHNYLFSSAETKAEFEKSPGKYAMQMGGLCARMAGTVTGNPSNFVVHDGRIYVFASDTCRTLFLKTPARYIPRPVVPLPAEAAAASRGRALLEKAAAAHGGARLDAATSYQETTITIQKRPTGDVSITTSNMWQFPGGARSERTFPVPAGPMTITTLLTPAGAWGIGPGRSGPVPSAVLPAVQLSLGRQLLPLLRTRTDQGLRIAALPPETVAGATRERVRIVRGGLDVTLNIDPASGRVHSSSFVDRNEQGEVGDILIVFDDLRAVEGVMVPFSEHAVFNGAPSTALSRTLATAAVNVQLDPKLFAPPAAGK